MKKIIKTYTASILISTCLGFLFTPIMTWNYSDKIIEQYLLVVAAINLFGLVLPLGLDEALVIYFNKEKKSKTVFECALPGVVLLTLLAPVIPCFLTEYLKINFYLALVIVIILYLYHVNRFASLINRLMFDHIWFPVNTVLVKIVPLIVIGIAVLMGYTKSVDSLVFSLLITSCVTSFVFTVYFIKNGNFLREKFSFRINSIINKFHYGATVQLAICMNWAILNTDKAFLARYSDSYNVASLSIVGLAVSLGMVLQSIFSTIWLPYGVKKALNNADEFKFDSKKILSLQKRVSWILVAIAMIFSPVAIKFFPDKYFHIYKVLPLALIPPIIYGSSEVVNVIFNTSSKQNVVLIITFMGLVLNLLSNYIFSPNGYVATTISFSACLLTIYVIKLLYMQSKFKCNYLREIISNVSIFLTTIIYILFADYNYQSIFAAASIVIIVQTIKLTKNNNNL